MKLAGQRSVVGGTLLQLHHQRVMRSLLNHTAFSWTKNLSSSPILPKFHLPAGITQRPNHNPGSRGQHDGATRQTHRTNRTDDNRINPWMRLSSVRLQTK